MGKRFYFKRGAGLVVTLLLGSPLTFADDGVGISKAPDVGSQSVSRGAPAPSGSGSSSLFTGSFLYNVPIDGPPGLSGMQPALSLQYNSSQGNGLAGVGWDLSLGSLQRSLKKGVPAYDATDVYLLTLKGQTQELTSVGKDSGGNFLYRSKIEDTVLKFVQSADGLQWTVSDKNGTQYYFGETSASRVQGAPGIFLWALDKVVDRNGLAMTISYTSDQNQLYPQDILYTSNNLTSPQRLADRKVHITFQPRPDPISSYRSKLAQVMAQRLSQIDTFVYQNGAWVNVKTTSVNYVMPAGRVRSELRSIEVTGKDGATTLTLPAGTFKSLSTGSGWASGVLPAPPCPSVLMNNTNNAAVGFQSFDYGARFVDLNGDGRLDMLLGRNENNASNGQWTTRQAFMNTPSGWQDVSATWKSPVSFCTFYWGNNNAENFGIGLAARIVDVNGDGRPDILDADSNQVWINNGAGWDSSLGAAWSLPQILNVKFVHSNSPSYEFVDLNADGRADIVYSQKSGSSSTRHVWINNGHGWTQNDSWNIPADLSIVLSEKTMPYGTRFVDINGDGLPDIVHSLDESDWLFNKIYLNTGSGWSEATWKAPGYLERMFEHYGRYRDRGIQFVDINGDGLLDWVESTQGEPAGLTKSVSRAYLNTGKGWVDASSSYQFPIPFLVVNNGTDQFNTYTNGALFLDVNGDGQPDLIESNTLDGKTTSRAWLSNAQPELLQSIHHPTGGETNLQYTCSLQTPSPQQIPFPVQLLTKIQSQDGKGGTVTTSYSYFQGLYESTQQEFLGFGKVISIDPLGNFSQTYYLQNLDADGNAAPANCFKGRVSRVESARSDGTILMSQETRWEMRQPLADKDVYFVRPAWTRVNLRDVSPALVSETDFTYDEDPGSRSYGNIIKTVYQGDTALTGDERTEIMEYAASTAESLLTLPKRTAVLGPDGTTKLSETFFYYDGTSESPMPYGKLSKGNVTQIHKWLNLPSSRSLITKLDTNEFGQVNSVKDSNGNQTTTTFDAFGFPETVTNALHQTVQTKVDPRNGNTLTEMGLNNQTTRYSYDALGRLLAAVGPLDSDSNPSVRIDYHDDLLGNPVQQNFEKRVKTRTEGNTFLWTKTFFDGLGRTSRSQHNDIDDKIVQSETEFDLRGLAARTSLPHFTTEPAQWIQTAYDPLGRVTQVQRPDGKFTQTVYQGRSTFVTDPNGHTQSSVSDAYGRILQRNEPSVSSPTLYTYDPLGNLTKLTDSQGKTTLFTYDSLGRKLSMIDPNAGQWSYSYDDNGNISQQTDARGVVLSLQYDPLNRLKSRTLLSDPKKTTGQNLGLLTTYVYDQKDANRPYSLGLLTSVEEANGITTNFYHDQLGRASHQSKQVGGTIYDFYFQYDALNRTTQVKYPNNFQANYKYDTAGRLSTVTDADGQVLVDYPTYDAQSRPSQLRIGNNSVRTFYDYDPLRQTLSSLRTESWETGAPVVLQNMSYQFDPVGNLNTLTDQLRSNRTQTFGYDSLNRLIGAQGEYGSETYGYDSLGNFQTKGGIIYAYGDSNHPYAVTETRLPGPIAQNDSTVFSMNLDPSEPLSGSTFTAGVYQKALLLNGQTDALVVPKDISIASSSLTAMIWVKSNLYGSPSPDPSSSPSPSPSPSSGSSTSNPFATLLAKTISAGLGRTIDGFRLLVSPTGQVIAEVGRPSGGAVTLTSAHPLTLNTWAFVCLTYDGSTLRLYLNAQPESSKTYSGGVLLSTVPVTLGGSLDTGGRLVSATCFNGALDEPRLHNRVWSLEELQKAQNDFSTSATYTYDPNGNMISKVTPGQAWSYRYDAQGRLTVIKKGAAIQSQIIYDGEGGRVKKISRQGTTLYIGKLFEVRPDGSQVNHIFAGGQLLADVVRTSTGATQTYFYHPDHLGSTSLVTDVNGSTLQSIGYKPFGETFSSQGTSPIHHKYTSQEEDPESGLYFYNSRYYDPTVGKFISPDAIVPSAMDPQSLNRYAYVHNSPTNLVDPDGHFFWVPIIVGAIIGAYSAGRATNWNTDYILKGALVGAIGGAIGGAVGNYAMGATGNAFLSGIIGGAAGGTASGYAGAAAFGGNRGIAMEQGALWGGIGGGLSQGLNIAGVPDAFAQAGSGYLSGHWQGGNSAANSGATYGFAGSVMGAAFRMTMGLDSRGRLPEMGSKEWETRFDSTKQTNALTPMMNLKDPNDTYLMLIGLISGGFEHTWHSRDSMHYDYSAEYPRYYYSIQDRVPYPGESYLDNFNIFTNNCTERVGYFSPNSYYANFNYMGPTTYWHD